MSPSFGPVRGAGLALAAILVFAAFIRLFHYDILNSSRGFRSVFSSSLSVRDKCNQPNDLILPLQPGRGIGAESFVGKVTAVFHGKDPTLVRAIQTHEAHSRHYGYSLLVLRHRILDDTWSKPAYLLAVLLEEMRKPEEHRLRWLMWVDADTIIMNHNIPLEAFLPPAEFPHLHLLVTADPHGLNNGVFFLKVHPWSIELLSAVVAYRVYRPDTELQYRDQSALEDVLKDKCFKKNFLLLPQRWFNAIWGELSDDSVRSFQVRRGDLLVHFPGHPQRDEIMRKFLDRAERHLPEWELDLESTSYPTEIKEYWTEQQDILERQRREAQDAAKDAENLLRKVGSQKSAHQDALDGQAAAKIDEQIQKLRLALHDHIDDKETVQEASNKLHEATQPLRTLAEQAQKIRLKQAHALIVESETELLRAHGPDQHDAFEDLQSKLDSLRELLARDPDRVEAVTDAMEELRKATGEVRG